MLYIALEDTSLKIIDRLVLNHIACNAKDRSKMISSNLVRDDTKLKKINKQHIIKAIMT
jgi:hypothetical protein